MTTASVNVKCLSVIGYKIGHSLDEHDVDLLIYILFVYTFL